MAVGAAGASVVVNHISNPEEAERVVGLIRAGGGAAIALTPDVSRENEVQQMFAAGGAHFGTIDILVSMPDCSPIPPFTR